jgi:hypothetical protein
LLYLLYSADLSISTASTNKTFAGVAVLLAKESNPAITSQKLQTYLEAVQKWLKKWRINLDPSQSMSHSPYEEKPAPPSPIKNVKLLEKIKYLGLHFEMRLTWLKHIFPKRMQLEVMLTKMYCLLGRKLKLATSNRLPKYYKAMLISLCIYGIQLCGTASISNIEFYSASDIKLCR